MFLELCFLYPDSVTNVKTPEESEDSSHTNLPLFPLLDEEVDEHSVL